MTDKKIIQLTGLWINEGKDGEMYLSGTLGNSKVLIFKNKRKEKDAQPDWHLCIGEKPPKQEQIEN